MTTGPTWIVATMGTNKIIGKPSKISLENDFNFEVGFDMILTNKIKQ